MRTIDADAIIPRIKSFIEAERQIYKKASWNFAEKCLTVVESAPTVSTEPEWIPCSKRLPKDLEEVNVTWVNHNPEQYYSFVKDVPFTASAIHYKGKWFWYSGTWADVLAEYGNNNFYEIDSDVEITAWMPLPKPYKGGKGERE